MIRHKKWAAIGPTLVILGCTTAPKNSKHDENIDLDLHLLNKKTSPQAPQEKVAAAPKSTLSETSPAPTPPQTEATEVVRMANSNATLVHNAADPSLADNAAEFENSEKPEESKHEVEVEELSSAQTPESETVEEDSELSPEDLSEILSREGPIESIFALCEDSVYMQQWQAAFDKKWLAENSKRYRRAKDKSRALDSARSQAFVSLVFPSIGKVESDYPVVINKEVLNWIEYFQTRGRRAMVTWLKRGEDVIPLAAPVLEKNGLPRDLVYLSMIESGFNNRALSIAAAVGPWQFIRSTGKLYGLRIDDFVDERRDPTRSTQAAARFLSDLYANLGDWHLAAASYNAGEGRIRGAKRRSSHDDFFSLSRARLLPNETRNYVPKLLAALIIGKYPAKFGFEVSQGSRAIAKVTIQTTRPLALEDIAREANIDMRLLENLNPELRHGITPPPTTFRPYYDLKVPESTAKRVETLVATLPEAPLKRIVAGKVNKKDNAGNFAARLGIPLAEFLQANGKMTARTRLTKGQSVFLPVTLGSGQYDKLTSSENKKKKKKAYKSSSKSKSSRKKKK